MNTVISKLRNLTGDNFKSFADFFQYNGISSTFTLTESNVDSTSILVQKNGSLWASSNYSFDVSTNKVYVTGTLVAGDILEITYSYYSKYSDTEMKGYIRAALSYLAVEKYEVFKAGSDNEIFPTPTEAEENLIALIASIVIQGSIRAYRTPEITIDFNEKLTKEEKIHHAIWMFRKAYGVTKYIKTDRDTTIPKEDEYV
jgi:hypothetical protein